MSMSQQTAEGAVMAVKAAPPVVATGWAWWGFTLNEWAAIFAILYSVLGIVFMLADRYKKWKGAEDE